MIEAKRPTGIITQMLILYQELTVLLAEPAILELWDILFTEYTNKYQ